MQSDVNLKKLAELARDEMIEDLGLKMTVDVGDDFFNALFYGTLKTFPERVDSSGFCHTCYGEVNDVKRYRHGHYPRDAAEAAWMLASCGFVDKATRILQFNLRNIPEGQYYIPHIYRPDGSIKANTIQVDTPMYHVQALRRCVEVVGPNETFRTIFTKLIDILEGTWERHFHPEWNLLDAGNCNEAVGGEEVTCDILTNSLWTLGCSSMAWLGKTFDRPELIETYTNRKFQLEAGIEKILYDPQEKIYRVKRNAGTDVYGDYIKWINLYPQRYYPGNPETWDNAFEILKETTIINWDGMEVICEYQERGSLIGQGFAQLLSYLGQTGRFDLLSQHLDFARKTITKPVNIYPEGWQFSEEEYKEHYKPFGNIWQAYETNPDGDYTIDSGNCEQCAVFLNLFIKDLLGVDVTDEGLHLWPKLPFDFQNVSVDRVPVRFQNGQLTTVSYELTRKVTSVDMKVITDALPAKLTLAIPAGADNIQVKINGSETQDRTIRNEKDVTWVSIILDAASCSIKIAF